jgi:hypothetical protein
MFESFRSIFTKAPKSKTLILGWALILLTAVQTYQDSFAKLMGEHAPLMTGVLGVVIIILRARTTMSLDDK